MANGDPSHSASTASELSAPAASPETKLQPSPPRRQFTLTVPLSRIQSIVGLTAGLLSITATVFSATQYWKPAPTSGIVVAVAQDAKSDRVLTDATVEILTPENEIVTRSKPDPSGEMRSTVKEGRYRVRISHPRYVPESRQIRVKAGHIAELHVRMRANAPTPPPAAAAAVTPPGGTSPLGKAERLVSDGIGSIRRVFGQ